MTKSKAEKKERLRDEALAELRRRGIQFHAFSPIHFRIGANFDFWPTTGKWNNRDTGKWGTGLVTLLAAMSEVRTFEAKPRTVGVRQKTREACQPACDESTLSAREVTFRDDTSHYLQTCEKCHRRKYLPRAYGIRVGDIEKRPTDWNKFFGPKPVQTWRPIITGGGVRRRSGRS